MPRKLLRRYLPPPAGIKNHWLLGRLGVRLHHPRLWHLNRRSVSGAAGVGLFVAFLPVPFQFVLAGLGALWLRVNLPLSVALIFVTNPLTMGPAYYGCYRVGAWLLGSPGLAIQDDFKPTTEWLFTQLAMIWQPLVVGSLVIGALASIIGYIGVELLWRGYILHKRGKLARSFPDR